MTGASNFKNNTFVLFVSFVVKFTFVSISFGCGFIGLRRSPATLFV
jgi:hypothetical protein